MQSREGKPERVSHQAPRKEAYSWPLQVLRAVMWSVTTGILWVIPWVIFVLVGSFYFDFVEARMPVADREYDGFGIAIIFYGVFFCIIASFFFGTIVGFGVALETETQGEFWPWQARMVQASFRWVIRIILVMLLGAAVAFFEEIIPLPF